MTLTPESFLEIMAESDSSAMAHLEEGNGHRWIALDGFWDVDRLVEALTRAVTGPTLRDRVAELLDAHHGEMVTEGGCDFQASWPRQNTFGDTVTAYDDVVDLIIEEVRRG